MSEVVVVVVVVVDNNNNNNNNKSMMAYRQFFLQESFQIIVQKMIKIQGNQLNYSTIRIRININKNEQQSQPQQTINKPHHHQRFEILSLCLY